MLGPAPPKQEVTSGGFDVHVGNVPKCESVSNLVHMTEARTKLVHMSEAVTKFVHMTEALTTCILVHMTEALTNKLDYS